MTRSRESNVVSLAEIKQRKMIAQYIAFYGYRKKMWRFEVKK